MVMGIIGGALGAGIPLAANALGIGKNNTRARTYAETQWQPGGYDPNAFQYGGAPGGAAAAAQQYGGLAAAAQNRSFVNPTVGGPDYSAANASQGQQQQMAGLMASYATGGQPLIAQQQASLQMQQAAAAQASAGASARGAGGLALAGQNAANNTATMQSAISNQAQINGAQEQYQDMQGAYNAYGGLAGQQAQQAQFTQGQAQAQNQFNASGGLQQQGLNNAYASNLYGLQNNVNQTQLNAGIAQQGMLANNQQATTSMNVGISQNNANREFDYLKMGMGGVQGGTDAASSMMAPSPAPAAGAASSAGSAGGAGGALSSDDRAKFGMSPLGLLGIGGNNPAAGQNVVAGISGPAYSMGPSGGMNVADTGRQQGLMSTGYGSDPSGGMMSGGLLSDDRAKRAVYALGRADGMQQAQRGEQVPYGVGKPLAGNEQLIMGQDGKPEIVEVQDDAPSDQGQDDYSEMPSGGSPAGPHPLSPMLPPFAPRGSRNPVTFYRDRPQADPVTQQFAQGLAPIRFQYKPGMGPGGEQTGVRAQSAASQPVTSSMVQQQPNGLLAIDPRMGLSTALAGVGHLSKKQQQTDQKLDGLLAAAANQEGY